MRVFPLELRFRVHQSNSPTEARLALRRAVQAMPAMPAMPTGFAEMDRLLDRAEQLISHRGPDYAPQVKLNSPIGPIC